MSCRSLEVKIYEGSLVIKFLFLNAVSSFYSFSFCKEATVV